MPPTPQLGFVPLWFTLYQNKYEVANALELSNLSPINLNKGSSIDSLSNVLINEY
jgi:hypothetical protein